LVLKADQPVRNTLKKNGQLTVLYLGQTAKAFSRSESQYLSQNGSVSAAGWATHTRGGGFCVGVGVCLCKQSGELHRSNGHTRYMRQPVSNFLLNVWVATNTHKNWGVINFTITLQ
jgi:hypothetical protein